MIFKFGITASNEINADLFLKTSNGLELFFKNKSYGIGIKEIIIGLVCINKPYEAYYKNNKPKYIKSKKIKGLDGKDILIENGLLFDCKIDFDNYLNSVILKRKEFLANEILKLTKEVLNKKEIKEFNKNKFIDDLESFFKQKS